MIARGKPRSRLAQVAGEENLAKGGPLIKPRYAQLTRAGCDSPELSEAVRDRRRRMRLAGTYYQQLKDHYEAALPALQPDLKDREP